jgi:heme/copper-type cytochrome/quinol oxidase subunit 3
VWPPPGQPYLPVEATWVNTGLLTFSAATMRRAVEAIRADHAATMRASLLGTAVLGAIFLIAQGSEWVRLVNHGLTLSSSVYGSMFYSLIGLHGLHVLGAVGWLGVVFLGAVRGRYSAERRTAVELCALYWYFVCGLWIVLFGLVYLG